jgi:molybdopterin/thiamine biosynthesis adenylyltransferase
MVENRNDRQILFLGKGGQEKIKKTSVGIVGVGGIGSQTAQALAYLGVETFVLIDDDKVGTTNLNRLVGATPEDSKVTELKIMVINRMIQAINPEAKVRPVPQNLRSKEALTALLDMDVIFGCVDHDGPRLILMELSAAYKKPYIDSATEIIPENGTILQFGGRVVVSRPGDFCLDCANQIDKEMAKQELESKDVQKVRRAHGYGLGNDNPDPSVVSLNGVVANLAITEFLFMVTGIREPLRHITYYGLRGRVNVRDDRRREECYTCGYLVGSSDQSNIFRYAL